jgi:hypothetical protein
LRHCATSRNDTIDSRWCHWNFHRHNPSGRTMALGSTRPLTEMRTRNNSRGGGDKGGRCVELQPYDLHVPNVLKSGSLNLLENSAPVQACNGVALHLRRLNMAIKIKCIVKYVFMLKIQVFWVVALLWGEGRRLAVTSSLASSV